MSKKQKNSRPAAIETEINVAQSVADVPATFGYSEMLSELEAIVADAEIRQAEEDAA